MALRARLPHRRGAAAPARPGPRAVPPTEREASAGGSRSSPAGLLRGVHSRGHCGTRAFAFPLRKQAGVILRQKYDGTDISDLMQALLEQWLGTQ